jgi:hypothetical protein
VAIPKKARTACQEKRVTETVTLTVPELDKLEALVDYGSQRMRDLAAKRGIDWDSLTENERQQLIDELIHES